MIQITVSFYACYTDQDDLPPADVYARESLTVELPAIQPKYIVLPKVIEGISISLIESLQATAKQHRWDREHPTLFEETAEAEDDDPIALAAHWPSLEDVELHNVLVAHTMDQLDPATRARCHQHGLILGLIDPEAPGALEHTWYQMQPSGDILRGELYGNFYECAAAALEYLDTLEEEEPAEEEPEAEEPEAEEPEPDEAAGEWHLTNFRTAEIDELRADGYQIQARWRRLGDGFEWQYRWSIGEGDRINVNASRPFASIEEAISSAHYAIANPAPIEELQTDTHPGDWAPCTAMTHSRHLAKLVRLAAHGYLIQGRLVTLGQETQWQYRWRCELPDRVDCSPPFTTIEDAMADARRYIDEPQEQPA